MKKMTKIWVIIASVLVLVGLILFAGVMASMKWEFTKLSTVEYVTNNHEIAEAYTDIRIIGNTADIVFVPSEDSQTMVTCHEQEAMRHAVSVKDGALTIEIEDTRKWYQYLSIGFDSPKITVALPVGAYGALSIQSSTGRVEIPREYGFASLDISQTTGHVTCAASVSGDLKIKTTTGSIAVRDTAVGSMNLSLKTGRLTVQDVRCVGDAWIGVSTGDATVTRLHCASLTSGGSTGDITLNDVIAEGRIAVERSTGDVKLNRCDAAALSLKTDTGDVEGSLLSSKVFVYHTDTGDVDLPRTTTGGLCEIETDTGDIEFKILW